MTRADHPAPISRSTATATFSQFFRRSGLAPRGAYLYEAPDQLRRGGRVVECTALEMRHGGNSIGGSNPSLSANHPLKSLAFFT